MTSDKRVKTRIRARMAKTGERYTTARHHYVDAPPGRQRSFGYELRGGLHPDTAAIANVLALLSVWEGASPAGMTGGSLRDLFADFLGEAQGLLEADLQRAIDPLRRAAHTWTELG